MLVLSRGLGFGAVTAVAMSVGAATVGASFGLTNPFQAGIALRYAGMPALSQPLLRGVLLIAAVTIWIAWTAAMTRHDDVRTAASGMADASPEPATARDAILLAIALVPFVPYVIGVLRFDWGFNELSALYLVAGFAVGDDPLDSGLMTPRADS